VIENEKAPWAGLSYHFLMPKNPAKSTKNRGSDPDRKPMKKRPE
jgi:hypothetical protein